MRIIRRRELKAMPWKNGGGTTYEVAIAPAGASLDAFDWRISIAHIEAPGPFSAFPGIDRSIAVLAGNGIILTTSERSPIALHADSPPWRFAGEWAIDCQLIDGPTFDLNVMVRRGRLDHKLTRMRLDADTVITRSGPITGLCLASGYALELATDEGPITKLGLHDFAVLDDDDGLRLRLIPHGGASCLLAELMPPAASIAGHEARIAQS